MMVATGQTSSCDCTDGTYLCSDSCAGCIDPSSADLAEGGQCYVAPPPACEDSEIKFHIIRYLR